MEQLPADPEAETLNTYMLHGKSLLDWYHQLTFSSDNKTFIGGDPVEPNRYGNDRSKLAWWAIALEDIAVKHTMPDDEYAEIAESVNMVGYYMGALEEDYPNFQESVERHGWVLPSCLKEMLGIHDN